MVRLLSHPSPDEGGRLLPAIDGGGRRGEGDCVSIQRDASHLPPVETREEVVQRSREVGNLLGRMDGLVVMTCACGVGIKVPPGSPWSSIPCPRCGRDNPVPKANEPANPGEPIVYRRQGTGWESFQCSCGASINLSPAFQGTSKTCDRCGRTLTIT